MCPVSAERSSPLRLLWVTQEVPDRSKGGGNIRQAWLIEMLSRWLDVDLMVVGEVVDEGVRNSVGQLTELRAPEFRDPRSHLGQRLMSLRIVGSRQTRETFVCRGPRRVLAAALGSSADRYDVVLVNHQCLAPLLPRNRKAQWLIHLHNVSAERTRQELATASEPHRRWLFRREAEAEERAERRAVESYDGLVTVSEEDAALLAGPDGARARGPLWVVPNGVDADRFVPTPLPNHPTLLFSASLNYRPNIDGATWFCQEVMPRLRARVPDVRFNIVGRDPRDEVLALATLPGVEVHADVPDMLPWMNDCRVAVVPLRLGTGTRLKALEAMAAGRPVVGTRVGLDGLGIVDGVHGRVVDEAEPMADVVANLLVDDKEAQRLSDAGRALVDLRYRWDTIAERFAGQLHEALASAGRAVVERPTNASG
jgi:glycosyltransferase involved in cell wall biosynthesis